MRLDDDLLREAKERAARSGRTLTSIIEEALRSFLHRPRRPAGAKSPALPTFHGRGLQPGVDLDNTAALMDLMDRGDDPR